MRQNYFKFFPVKCCVCGKTVRSFYAKDGVWYDKYLTDNETKVCINCMKDRPGFREEFKKLIGITVEESFRLENE